MDTVTDFLYLNIEKLNKKKLLKVIGYFSIKSCRVMLNQTKYILKILSIFIFRFIKKKMPSIVMNWCKTLLFSHPTIHFFLKKMRLYITDIEKPNNAGYIKYLLSWITKKFCLPLIELIFSKTAWKIIFFNQLKEKPNLLTNFYPLFTEKPRMCTDEYQHKSLISEYNSQISSSAEIIYLNIIKEITKFKQTN